MPDCSHIPEGVWDGSGKYGLPCRYEEGTYADLVREVKRGLEPQRLSNYDVTFVITGYYWPGDLMHLYRRAGLKLPYVRTEVIWR